MKEVDILFSRFWPLYLCGMLLLLYITSCKSKKNTIATYKAPLCQLSKMTFDLNSMDADGLMGEKGDKVLVDYEFCIPDAPKYLVEVKVINPQLNCIVSNGRSGCKEEQLLCIGNTGQGTYRSVLCRLSQLSYIREINRVFWE